MQPIRCCNSVFSCFDQGHVGQIVTALDWYCGGYEAQRSKFAAACHQSNWMLVMVMVMVMVIVMVMVMVMVTVRAMAALNVYPHRRALKFARCKTRASGRCSRLLRT
jgi:hypothetical protein